MGPHKRLSLCGPLLDGNAQEVVPSVVAGERSHIRSIAPGYEQMPLDAP